MTPGVRPLRIGIIVGSTRPGRVGGSVGRWIHGLATARGGADFHLLDLRDFDLPLLDEPGHPSSGGYLHDHTRRWSEAVAACDGFIFVTPEYNHAMPAVLKNALDYLYSEWTAKPCSFVAYGGSLGARAIASLRLVMGELLVADLRGTVGLSTRTDFVDGEVRPGAHHDRTAHAMLDELIWWARGLQAMRSQSAVDAAMVELA